MMTPKQLAFRLRTHGGKRRGAGRKPKGNKPLVSHAARPVFDRATPVHVTLRLARHVWSMRSRRCFSRISRCFQEARERFAMRLIEFSVQGNHLHMIVEADDTRALSRGMQGLCIRIARALNRLMARSGKVFADHFHSRLLPTPTELTRTIDYVRNNRAHHFPGEALPDAYSSALPQHANLLATPVGWLLLIGRFRVGWMAPARPI
jgi:REP element-mobilizing transposase RayT